MITARPPFGARRTCRGACRGAGVLRLCWLGVLLLGVLYAHGIGVEGASGHVSPETVTAAVAVDRSADLVTSSAAVDRRPHLFPAPGGAPAHGTDAAGDPDGTGHHHGEDSPHPGGECLSAQPQDGPSLAVPATACTPDVTATHSGLSSGTVSPDGAWRGSHGPPYSGRTAVLRI
ncbi:hypothetical protein [Streptomyces jeddahensis]|uniref:Uncharacterized protein n=1 Tax=Streptomyces jeddahensis TaxID=1716141 RepID=A0A177HK65_9ACTN|nr:hypothetical protein [Streptomyces jeddahensis]OAH11126.1 hypothetical protein STSP_55030 [Streptomyces jeddahensis]